MCMDAPIASGMAARVLVADGDALSRAVVRDAMAEAGYRVDTAADGGAALAELARRPYDLLVVDWRMPVRDGLEVVRAVRAWQGPGPRIIMLTAMDDPAGLADALEAGADDYIKKPADPLELIARAGAALRGGRVRAADEQMALFAVARAAAEGRELAEVLNAAAGHVANVHRGVAAGVARLSEGRTEWLGSWAAGGRSFETLAGRGAFDFLVDGGGMLDDRTAAAVPVRLGGEEWGAVAVATDGEPLPGGAEQSLARFAEVIALAVGSDAARTELAVKAATDALTGLANRRVFWERMGAEVARAQRYGRDLAVAVLDLDHFKAVNDTYGHGAGDAVLREAGRRLAEQGRRGDLVARIGGEEFAWLMPETDAMEAWQAAERARADIAGAAFPEVGRITIAAGVCDLSRADDAEEIFSRADAALYWAKSQGRDVVFLYAPEVMEVLTAEERAALLRRNQGLQSIRLLARAVDGKDPSTHRHSERVAELAESIATELGWTTADAARLHEATLVHDVGKIAIADELLFKPERLSAAELARVRIHPSLGGEIVSDVFDTEQIGWVRGHHERWDGKGYPDGLTAEEGPEGAAILHLANAWDVMTTSQPYSVAIGREQALAECREHAGTQFSPRAVAALAALLDDDRVPELSLAEASAPR